MSRFPVKTAKKRVAAGSHATKDGYEEVTHCATCGEKIVISRQSLQFETDLVAGTKVAWHRGCGRPVRPPA